MSDIDQRDRRTAEVPTRRGSSQTTLELVGRNLLEALESLAAVYESAEFFASILGAGWGALLGRSTQAGSEPG